MVRRRTSGRPWWLIAAPVVAGLLVGALCAGCAGPEINGTAQPSGANDPNSVGGLPVTNGPSGLKPGAPAAKLTVQGTDHGQIDQLAEDALSDIFDYWSQAMPQNFGTAFTKPSKLISYDSTKDSFTDCGQNINAVENAFYCAGQNSVSWDRGALLPQLVQQFGPMAVVLVFAHEMGHFVQFHIGAVTQSTDTIIKEQQADCYAGAFMRWTAEGNAPHFQLSTGDGLDRVMGTMVLFRDPMGSADTGSQAHGTSFDRITAFQYGFEDGPQRCDKINAQEIHQRITELGFTNENEAQNNDNLPVNDQTLTYLQTSLNDSFTATGSFTPPAITSDGGASCGDGSKSTPPASFCVTGNTISVDQNALQQIATPPQNGDLSAGAGSGGSTGGIGDFAAFAEIASRYVLAVQRHDKLSITSGNAAPRTACLTGAWAGIARHGTGDPNNKLRLGSDDLDKAVAEMLSSDSLIAADANGTVVPAGFVRIEAFRVGFLQGAKTCTNQYP
ncbi:MAG TPA: neutral zinc metallopeptidase [Pseudonocardiaceae bacterium]|jgi:predicted metalloprotease|nr:neutral zinc metallopeptidase [Pseudonocardiaceae bacterium]